MSKFRLIPLGAALLACVAWAFLAVTSYPIIVIADSDLGMGAMERVEDALAMLGFAVAAAVLATRIIPWFALRLALIVVLLGFLAAHPFDSAETSHAARWPVMAILGLAVVAEWAEVRRPLSQRLHPLWLLWVAVRLPEEDHIEKHHEEVPALKPLWLLCVAVLVPLLVVLSDWRGRLCLGHMATKTGPRPDQRKQLRTSVSLLDSTASEAISRQDGLRAVGSRDGNLTVEPLAYGPSFFLPASQPEHMLQVLTFSPDGKVLAVADNHCMYEGSVITVWDVKPGDQRTPPSVVRRHTLGGHPHWTFSMDFFPDSRTLVSANGDKTVSLWDLATGKELASFVPHRHPKGYWDTGADCVAAAPDGQSFVTWETMDGIKVWERQSLRLLRQLDTSGGIPCSLAFMPDGSRLIAADRESVRTWELHPNPLPFVMSLALLVTLVCWLFWPYSLFRRMPVVAAGGVRGCQQEARS